MGKLIAVAAETIGSLTPTFDELSDARSPNGMIVLYTRFLTAVAVVSASASVVFGILLALAFAPSIALAAVFFTFAMCTPLILAGAIVRLQQRFFPASPSWYSALAVAAVYPASPGISIGLVGGLLSAASCFPLIYCTFVIALVLNQVAGIFPSLQTPFTGATLAMSLPAILPNFFVMYMVVVPAGVLTLFVWAPVVAVQTWVLLLPAWITIQFLRSKGAEGVSSFSAAYLTASLERLTVTAASLLSKHDLRSDAGQEQG
jgi:hypothetical protein